jgi:transcriptional regulator with XRE-family HTH domain
MANDLLRALREAAPSPSGAKRSMTRAELAEAVNQYIWATSHKKICLDADTLARYERGQIRWPSATYREGLRAVLGVESDPELGFFPTPRGKVAVTDLGTWVASWSSLREAADHPGSSASATGLAALRRAVQSGPSTQAKTTDAKDSPTAVRRRVATAFATYQAGRYEDAACHAAAAIRAVQQVPAADARVQALAYQIAAIVLSKARHTDLARLAADQGMTAAEQAGDPYLRLSLLRTTAFTKAASGHRTDALVTIADAAADFSPRMARTALAASVYGTMLLTGALLAAGHGNRGLADTYLDEAHGVSQIARADRNDLWTAFGPSNVAIHRTNVAAATGDMDVALASGGQLRVDHLPTERRVRLHLDVARASLAVGDREDALATLVRAEIAAPSQVRQHHITRDVVTQLISSTRRRPGVELTRLAELTGVPVTPV